MNKEPIDYLEYWIRERYKVFLKKEAGEPAPWSNHSIFQETYFCNVHRENDRVTRWIRENWNYPTTKNYVFAIILARFVNKPSTLEKIGYPFNWDEEQFIRIMQDTITPWGGAYIVSTSGCKMPKALYIGQLLTGILTATQVFEQRTTLALAHTQLMALPGLGSFMAAQVVADLKNTKHYPLNKAKDWWTWCAHGPGSLRGMAWVNGTQKCTPTEFKTHIPLLRMEINERLYDAGIPKFCNQDLQNSLCEFDKFMRIKNGTGRSKRRYNGKAS